MRTKQRLVTVLAVLVVAAALGTGNSTPAQAAQADVGPVAVSPGSATGSLIGDACPTFSWCAVSGARSYELVVYRVEDSSQEARPVLERSFPGSVTTWTPSLGSCLARGARYAWNVRAVGQDQGSDWSPLNIFQVTWGPSEAEFEAALEVVKSYLAAGGNDAEAVPADEPAAAPERSATASRGAPGAGAAPAATQLSVDGNIAATSFTGDGENLANVATDAELATHAGEANAHHVPTVDTDTFVTNKDAHDHLGGDGAQVAHSSLASVGASDHHTRYTDAEALAAFGSTGECEGFPVSGRRYVDRGDGTVRDCNTGKIWLKDASCLGNGQWGLGGGTVQTKVANLNSGTDFGCSGYTPGTYTDWEIPAMATMCGMWNGSCTGTACCTASQGLVATSVSGSPKVANGTGDARWTPGNVFVGVQSMVSEAYWSSTELDAVEAWAVLFIDGRVLPVIKGFNYFVWPVRVEQ